MNLRLFLLALQWYLGQRAVTALASFPRPSAAAEARPGVSVIIPARNEAQRLPGLLNSLTTQIRPGDELVVVDDSSTDQTALVAEVGGARVVGAGELPPGWLGKAHACWRGAGETSCDWLLFVDADVTLDPRAIDRALGYALSHEVQAISALGRQELGGFGERLLVPFAYRHYFAGHGAAKTINGQFLLIARKAYNDVGGHAAVRHRVAEDVELAALMESRGVAFELLDGRGLFSVRMYRSLAEIASGFGKNSGGFLKADLVGGLLTVISTTLALLPYTGVLTKSWLGRLVALVAIAADVRSASRFEQKLTDRPVSIGPWLQLLAQPVFVAIVLRGMISRQVRWKGRRLS